MANNRATDWPIDQSESILNLVNSKTPRLFGFCVCLTVPTNNEFACFTF